MKIKALLLPAAAATMLADTGWCVEALSTPELAEHCAFYHTDREGKDAIFCVRYVQGFIDGAVATDQRVIENVSAEIDEEESFSQRAIRTRIVGRMSRGGPTVYADFCLGGMDSLQSVVEKVVNDLASREVLEEQLLARDAVFSTLRREYPCEPDAGD